MYRLTLWEKPTERINQNKIKLVTCKGGQWRWDTGRRGASLSMLLWLGKRIFLLLGTIHLTI